MEPRPKLIVANWKMNKEVKEARSFIIELKEKLKGNNKVKVVIAAPFTDLPALVDLKSAKIYIAAQNLYPGEKGAFTGEISGVMLKPLVSYVILGHSERRCLFGENDQLIKEKVKSALFFGLKPIICLGETAEEKEAGLSKQIVMKQLEICLFPVDKNDIEKVVLCYEPVWAISSAPGSDGKGDSPENAQVMHRLIRHFVQEKFGGEIADQMLIIYGGSLKETNAEAILKMPDIDGGLIGKSSLQIASFFDIIKIATELS
ncbi:triose-phosphate isomerase [Patescibacteria group bacterium]|nr:triose-phosphate isomerase [Patescibacteria group bacterium]